jgi:hypothetical protein
MYTCFSHRPAYETTTITIIMGKDKDGPVNTSKTRESGGAAPCILNFGH